jgi:glucan phosphoethanolaminetransferase (alkaline phosphatase superfamily)
MSAFLHALNQPEYVHTLINPLPIYGLALGLIALIIALFMHSRSAQIPALVVIFIAAASAWPVAYFGHEGYDPVLSMSDETGAAWLKAHERRADILVWFYYALALIVVLVLFLPRKFPKTKFPLVTLTLLLGFFCLAGGGYVAYAGGKVRHREFRNEPPPATPAEDEQ